MLLAHTNIYITIPPDNDAPSLDSLAWDNPRPVLFLSFWRNNPGNASHNTRTHALPTQYSRECVAKKRTPHSRCPRGDYVTRGAPPRRLHYVSFHHMPLLCYLFPAHPRALPYPMGTSSDPASLPYHLAAFCITNYSKTALAKRPTRCLFRSATPLLVL